jgi:hypothetical protein
MKIKNNETEIIGKWIVKDGEVIEDENSKRVHYLIKVYLNKVSKSESSGWESLYIDPNDKRYWELKYLNSECQGGGPPSLFCITEYDAMEKYRQENSI